VNVSDALLRHHREAVRWTVEEAAAELGCNASKISRIETGHRRAGARRHAQAAHGLRRVPPGTAGHRGAHPGRPRGLVGRPDGMVDHALLESAADDVMVYDPPTRPRPARIR